MSIEIEVGLYSLMHTGMLGTLNQPQDFDRNKVALLVYNDARDVRYEFESVDGKTEEVVPSPGNENCVVIAVSADHMNSIEDVRSERLFCHVTSKQTWPRKMFQCMHEGGEIGDLDTAFVLHDTDYRWTNHEGDQYLHTSFETSAALKAFKVVRGNEPPEPILGGASIKNVTLHRTGGAAQKCCPTGDPP